MIGFRAASQKLGILRKSWRVFHDRSLVGRCFLGFVLPVLEYCPAVWCSAADTHLKLLDRAVSGVWFLSGGVFECNIAHCRSVAVLCNVCNCVCCIRSGIKRCTRLMELYLNRMCQSGDTLCPGRTSVYLCFASLQNHTVLQDFCSPLSVPLVGRCGTYGFQEPCQCFLIGLSCSIPTIVFYYFLISLISVHSLVLWGWGLLTDRVISLFLSPALQTSFNNNNNNNNNIACTSHACSVSLMPITQKKCCACTLLSYNKRWEHRMHCSPRDKYRTHPLRPSSSLSCIIDGEHNTRVMYSSYLIAFVEGPIFLVSFDKLAIYEYF